MSTHPENPHQPTGPDQRSDDPRIETLRLVRAVGRRLRSPLEPEQRDELVTRLAATTTHTAAGERSGVRSLRTVRSALGPGRPRRIASVAAALVVLAGAVGVSGLATRSTDLPVFALAADAGGSDRVLGGPVGAPSDAPRPELGMPGVVPDVTGSDGMLPDIGWWAPVRYVFTLADGVGSPAGKAPAWRLVAPKDIDAASARLAAEFGLSTPKAPEWDPTSRMAESPEGGTLWVSSSGDWSFHAEPDPAMSERCFVEPGVSTPGSGTGSDGGRDPVDAPRAPDAPDAPVTNDGGSVSGPDGGVVGGGADCAAPTPPQGVPSSDEARALASELLRRTGHEQVRIVSVHRDEWGASVEAQVVVRGASEGAGMWAGVGFGGGGRVQWASGTLATAELVGDYPLIGATEAVTRLEEQMGSWFGKGPAGLPMPEPMPEPMPRDGDSPVTILPAPGVAPGSDGPGTGTEDGQAEDVQPVEQEVLIVSIELVHELIWTADQQLVLLPHFRLVDRDGGWWSVAAVESRYLAR